MAIQVDWPNSAITVDQSDCTLVSGTFYTLDTNVFRLALKALEDNEQGINWPRTHTHNTEVTVAGTTYVRTIEIINGYTVEFLPNTLWTCQLSGSNNNIWSVGDGVLVQNSVQVIGTNSAGYITVETGVSGLTGSESQALIDIAADQATITTDIGTINTNLAAQLVLVTGLSEMELAEHITSSSLGKIILRNPTSMRRWEADAWEDEARTIAYKGDGLEVAENLVEVSWS